MVDEEEEMGAPFFFFLSPHQREKRSGRTHLWLGAMGGGAGRAPRMRPSYRAGAEREAGQRGAGAQRKSQGAGSLSE